MSSDGDAERSGEGEVRVHTFCRVCEPACGLIARVRDGELVKLEPDRSHPVTAGFACHKGLAGHEIHRDPDRVDHPLRRQSPGHTGEARFERVSWDVAIEEVGSRLRALIDEHGPDAVAAYVGNPTAFNTLAGAAIGGLLAQLGTRRTFNSGTQDCANKFAGSEAVFGSATMHPVPDLAHTDVFLCLGANPRVSHASFFSIADPVAELKAAVKRGARVVYVNPREIETPAAGAGETIRIRPDTDVYLLAAMLCEIDRSVGFDRDAVAQHGRHVDGLRAFVAEYTPERVAPITGIDAAVIRELACAFATAGAASVHMSTGVNMGRQGTLAYWLVHMLAFLTGNLDRRGGNILSEGFYRSAKAGRREFDKSFVETDFGTLRRGALPGNLLADCIELDENPVRALIVVAGNPVLSIGGEHRLRRAIEKLELVVVIDLYRNATAEMADFVLPCTDAFEREDVNITGLGLQYRPWVQLTPRVVAPRGERREEWWILGRIAQALGFRSPFDAGADGQAPSDPARFDGGIDPAKLWSRIDHMLADRGLSIEALRAEPQGVAFGELEPGRFYDVHLQTPDRRVDCRPVGFDAAIERCRAIFADLEREPAGSLKLITRREPTMHNTWYANLARFKRGDRSTNRLYIHPDDAGARGVEDGQLVQISSEWGALEVAARFDAGLLPGVVALTHGWGNAGTPGMRIAHDSPGVNPNALLPSGPGSFEPLSSQAFMTGIPVEIVAAG